MANDKSGESKEQSHDHWARLALIVIVIAILVAFILGNREKVRISFVFFDASFSLIWALLVTNLLGFGAGYLLHGRMAGRSHRAKS